MFFIYSNRPNAELTPLEQADELKQKAAVVRATAAQAIRAA